MPARRLEMHIKVTKFSANYTFFDIGFFFNNLPKRYKKDITIIKMVMPDNSGFVKFDSSHIITQTDSSGIITPPGTRKVFSPVAEPFFLSFKVANTIPR